MSNTPSDDGLFELIKEHFDLDKRPFDTVIDRKTGRFHDAARYRDFASAVLARWGTPQPAPLSDDVVKDAARYRWLRNKSTVLHGTAWLGSATAYQRDVDFLRRDDALAALDAAIDAALAAQGGKV